MAYWVDYFGANYKDFFSYGNSNDTAYGLYGNDTIYGWNGNDKLYGGLGNDKLYGEAGHDSLYGEAGKDMLYGGTGNDYLSGGADYDQLYGGTGDDTMYGGTGYDDLYGGAGVDKMYGGTGADYFYFYTGDTGDVYANKADTIYDFSNADQIFLKGTYTYAGNTTAPGEGQYSIWQKGSDWVVTYNSVSDAGYHDIVVKGGDPHGDISFF